MVQDTQTSSNSCKVFPNIRGKALNLNHNQIQAALVHSKGYLVPKSTVNHGQEEECKSCGKRKFARLEKSERWEGFSSRSASGETTNCVILPPILTSDNSWKRKKMCMICWTKINMLILLRSEEPMATSLSMMVRFFLCISRF